MKKEIIAGLLLLILLLPMYAGIKRLKRLPPPRQDDPPEP